MLVVAGSTPVGSVMCVDVRPSAPAVALIFDTKALTLPASQSASTVAMSAPESTRRPSRASSSVSDSPAAMGSSDYLGRLPGLIRGECVGGDGNGRTVGSRCQAVVREDDVRRQQLGETSDRDGLGLAHLAHGPHADHRRRCGSGARPRERWGRPREVDGQVSRAAPGAVGPNVRWHRRRARRR